MERGGLMRRHLITLQVLDPVRKPDGGVDPKWVDVLNLEGNVMPYQATTRARLSQEGQTITHTVRLRNEPVWRPINRGDKGHPWPGLVRFVYRDSAGRYRVLLYQGGYDAAEAGQYWQMTATEESEHQQFPN